MSNKILPQPFVGYSCHLNKFKQKNILKYNFLLVVITLLVLHFDSNAQNLITTPTTLQNYHTDNATNKGVNVAVSEDGNVAVKGSPNADNGKGAVTLYIRNNAGVWTSSQLEFPNDYKKSFWSFFN